VKLLRVLQEREFFRVGGTEAIKANIRVIAATNREPEQAVAEGRMRQDLYFRLNVVSLRIPPLRERRGDIPLLATHFLSKAAHRMNKRVSEIVPEAFDCLLAYPFPGNIRELENVMERAVALAENNVITADLLPESMRRSNGLPAPAPAPDHPLLSLAEMERLHIQRVLEHTQGNRAMAAQLLGIDRVSLWRKLRSYSQA
jgi:transcriptional regulator with PAS, ATPase and Fis domain